MGSRVCAACSAELQPDANFCDECGAPGASTGAAETARSSPASYTPKHLADKIQSAGEALAGERKTITALFADIKGSMELMEDLDPEEARALIEPTLQIMLDAVHRYEGYVAQVAGDGIFAMFGAPLAHEDHAQRALYAALLMQEKCKQYTEDLRRERGLAVHLRIGVNTGEVLVREIRRDDLHTDYDPIGHSTGLAARMEALAAPGTVLASENTHRLAEGYFQFDDLGPAKVKGVTAPVHIFRVTGVGPLRTRIQVATRRGLTRFVGRRDELELMKRAIERARAGHGQIVAIMGEAGVGKSRLVHEFKVVEERKSLLLEAFSVSHGKAHAFLPLIDILKTYFGIDPADDERKKREKIGGRVLMLDRALEDTLPYLFALLGVSDQDATLRHMDGQIRRRRTLEAAKRLLLRESMNQPMVVVFEDLHWIDAETQAFLDLLVDSLANAKILLLVNYRPEYRHEWAGKTYYTRLRLDPLGEEEAEEMLTCLLGEEVGASLGPIARMIRAKTEGNPFFTEEIVRTLVEEGVLSGEFGNYRLERPAEQLRVPTTVQGVLAARIDRLAPTEKSLLQTLAVLGKDFSLGLARAVAEQSEDEMLGLLARLQAAEFVYEQPAFPEPDYTFKHALTQEVAYQSIPVERRKQMHEVAARAIEALHSRDLPEHYNALAHHYEGAENARKAVEYLQLAGEQALERAAYEDAVGRIERALALLGELPDDRSRDQAELLLQTTLGRATISTHGWGSDEVKAAFGRSHELCERLDDDFRLFIALWALAFVFLIRAELGKAQELADRAWKLSQKTGDAVQILQAHRVLGLAAVFRGERKRAAEHFAEVRRLYDPNRHGQLAAVYPLDALVSTQLIDGLNRFVLGFYDQGLALVRDGLRRAEELADPFSIASALLYLGIVSRLRGDLDESRAALESCLSQAEEYGFGEYHAFCRSQIAELEIVSGQTDTGAAQLEEIMPDLRTTQAVFFLPHWCGSLAAAHAELGNAGPGLALVAEALAVIEKTGVCADESAVQRTKGELLLVSSPPDEDEAERCFLKAIEVARAQEGKGYELTASTALARLWQQQGRIREARELLAGVYGWFTEGHDTKFLKEAKALLEELGEA